MEVLLEEFEPTPRSIAYRHRFVSLEDPLQEVRLSFWRLTKAGHKLMEKEFTERVAASAWVRMGDVPGMVERIADWSNGQAQVTVAEAEWVGVRSTGEFVFDVLR